MANVIFYSTGEIFWVTDPPAFRSEHIGVNTQFPPVPPDEFFTYAQAARALIRQGHKVVGAFGRQRRVVRGNLDFDGFEGDPEFLALGSLDHPEQTVLILIATESGTRAQGGVDHLTRIPFTDAEVAAFAEFRRRGGGVYVTWDHGQLGYQTLAQLGLEGPVEPEPDEPLRPNTAHSLDSTDSGKVTIQGIRRRAAGNEVVDVELSLGPPAGYLQRIIPAQLIYKAPDGTSASEPPHPIFNGVGSIDGIWIPAHMHEGILKAKVHFLFKLDERRLPPDVRVLALHIPLNETSFNVFPVMAVQAPKVGIDGDNAPVRGEGGVLWDTSFHHLVDINWSSDGQVPWEPFVPFSAASLWQMQFPKELFEKRLEAGMARLFANAISWLAGELPDRPSRQQARQEHAAGFAAAAEPRQEHDFSADDVPEYF